MMTTQTKTLWKVDAAHSAVQFKVRHIAVSNVSGIFRFFSGEATSAGEDFSEADIKFEIDTAGIDTGLADRDNFLRSDAFFDAVTFPKISFAGALHGEGENYMLTGNLTIKGFTREIHFETGLTGIDKGRFGDTRAGFEVSGKINRKDYGLAFNLLTETGNLVVGEEIKLHFDIQVIRQEG